MRPLAITAMALLVGCGFFQELGPVGSTGGEAGDTEGDTEGAEGETALSCEQGEDACLSQDTLRSCDPTTGNSTLFDCAAECGTFTNFACVAAGAPNHLCWCVEPGKQKVLSCTELESCLVDCGNAIGSACTDRCFARTNTAAVRLYGALMSCAHVGCEDICRLDAAACESCLAGGLSGQSGDCAVERAVCDNDRNDDPFPG